MIFVMGATGYTGRFVVDALRSGQFEVRCLVRPKSDVAGLDLLGVPQVTGDLADPSGWVDALVGVDAVMSVAHLKYAPMVIEACRKAGVSRVVFFSSTWRFSRVKTPAVAEVVAGERAVMNSGLDYTLLRPTMIFGPGDDRNISKLRAFVHRRPLIPIVGGGHQLVQPVYVEDVAQAAVGALLRSGAVGKAYELAGATPMTYNEMIDVLIKVMGRTVLKVHVPLFLAMLMSVVGERITSRFPLRSDQVRRMREHRAFDIDSAVRELGFAPRSFEDGVRDAMRINGELE